MLNSSVSFSPNSSSRVVIDLGTGDGSFVYQSARRDPERFYIGIDANRHPLERISEKIMRKPERGGAPNVLFVQAAVEDLPEELSGLAGEVHIHFPWGSLLAAVASGIAAPLRQIRRICAAGALVEVVVGIDPERDRFELDRLGITSISLDQIDDVLTARYSETRLPIIERGTLGPAEWRKLHTSWARRLRDNDERTLFYWIARATE